MKIFLLLLFVFSFLMACSRNESSSTSANFDPIKPTQEDPLKLGTGACKIDEKKDCDTTKK